MAVVGLSSQSEKPSHIVAAYLQKQGYWIIPVNPKEKEILGEQCYPHVAAIAEKVDIVDVFRRSEHTPPIVAEAVQADARYIWLQEGIVSLDSYRIATNAGLPIIMNMCILKEHQRLGV